VQQPVAAAACPHENSSAGVGDVRTARRGTTASPEWIAAVSAFPQPLDCPSCYELLASLLRVPAWDSLVEPP
jgi:hypothetical protein